MVLAAEGGPGRGFLGLNLNETAGDALNLPDSLGHLRCGRNNRW
jgi:hypothetical protein